MLYLFISSSDANYFPLSFFSFTSIQLWPRAALITAHARTQLRHRLPPNKQQPNRLERKWPEPTRNKCGRLKQGCEPPAVTPDCAGPFADSLDILCCKKKKKEWNTIKRKYFTCISLIFSICATSLTPLTHQANFLGIQLDWARTDNQTKKPTHSWTHVHWKC